MSVMAISSLEHCYTACLNSFASEAQALDPSWDPISFVSSDLKTLSMSDVFVIISASVKTKEEGRDNNTEEEKQATK